MTLETITIAPELALHVIQTKDGFYMQWETPTTCGPRIGTARHKPYKTLEQLRNSKTYKFYKPKNITP